MERKIYIVSEYNTDSYIEGVELGELPHPIDSYQACECCVRSRFGLPASMKCLETTDTSADGGTTTEITFYDFEPYSKCDFHQG
jgi:hypothetical protein